MVNRNLDKEINEVFKKELNSINSELNSIQKRINKSKKDLIDILKKLRINNKKMEKDYNGN